jgi:hypothetical protein
MLPFSSDKRLIYFLGPCIFLEEKAQCSPWALRDVTFRSAPELDEKAVLPRPCYLALARLCAKRRSRALDARAGRIAAPLLPGALAPRGARAPFGAPLRQEALARP